MAKNSIHTAVFDTYELTKVSKQDKETMRKHINKAFEEFFPNENWLDLSKLDKHRFIYIILREFIFKYVDQSKHQRINQKINKFLNTSLLEADIAMNEYNSKIAKSHKIYYKESDSDNEKQNAYAQFSKDLSNINDLVPIPSYEDWITDNKIQPRRIYDYHMAFCLL